MIGGELSKQEVHARLLPCKPAVLSADEVQRLWELFVQIGRTWGAEKEDPLYQRIGKNEQRLAEHRRLHDPDGPGDSLERGECFASRCGTQSDAAGARRNREAR